MSIQDEELQKIHKKLAISNFNRTWDLIDISKRTKEQDLEMIHTAHASLFHWMQIGEPINFARGEWQVSRVYNLLGMGDSALLHGLHSLDLCLKNNIGDFDLAFGYETVARAYKNLGDVDNQNLYYEKALIATEQIAKKDDKKYTLSELKDLK